MVIMCNRKVGFPVGDTVQLSHVLQEVAITQFISQSPSITEVDLLLRVCLEPIIWYSSLSAVGHRYSRYNWLSSINFVEKWVQKLFKITQAKLFQEGEKMKEM